MAYSTIAELRANTLKITTSVLDDTAVTGRIGLADKRVETDLGNIIDFSLVPSIGSTPDTPDYINLLSQYKTAEYCLVTAYGAKRETKDTDVEYWQECYNKLLESILAGSVSLELSDGTGIGKGTATFSRDSRDGVEPEFGTSKWGKFQTNSDLQNERPEQ